MPWKNCPDKERAKVPGINLAIGDMANPCELAKKFKVKLNQLRAFQVHDGATRETKNDFVIARKSTAAVSVRSIT